MNPTVTGCSKGTPVRPSRSWILPESFNVLIRELQALCLDVELMKTKARPALEPPAEEVPAAEPTPPTPVGA